MNAFIASVFTMVIFVGIILIYGGLQEEETHQNKIDRRLTELNKRMVSIEKRLKELEDEC